jgi:hypothetical protein
MHKMNINIRKKFCFEVCIFEVEYTATWSYQVSLKRRCTFTRPYCITSHKRGVIIFTAKKAFSGIFMKSAFYRNCLLTTFRAQQFSLKSLNLFIALSFQICCLQFISWYEL